MPIPHPTDRAKWRIMRTDPDLAMREARAYYAEAAAPETWTVGLLAERLCRLWARCPGCGLAGAIDLGKLVEDGRGALLVKDVKPKCHECGTRGHPVVTWIGTNNQRSERNFTTGETKGWWRGAYPFKSDKDTLNKAFNALRNEAAADGSTTTG